LTPVPTEIAPAIEERSPVGAEERALVDCLHVHLDPSEAAAVFSGLPSSLDWDRLFSLACSHKVTPLLLDCLTQHAVDMVPRAVLSELRLHVQAGALHKLHLTHELLRVVAALQERGIDVVPFKGPVAAQMLFGDLGKRSFNDLDILVRPRHLQATGEALQSLGYHCEFNWSPLRKAAYMVAGGYHYGYHGRDARIRVEVHWRLSPRKLAWPLETEGFWQRLEPVTIAGKPILANPPEDLLLMLCVHGARHWWGRLNWICDIAALLRRYPDLDWKAVNARARSVGGERMLRLGLRVAHDVLGARLPHDVWAAIEEDAVVASLTRDVQWMLFRDVDLEATRKERWSFYLRLRERVRDRVQYALGQTFNTLFWKDTDRIEKTTA
jgi:hypothetical protein